MSTKDQSAQDKLDHERDKAKAAHTAFINKWNTDYKNFQDTNALAMKTLQEKFGSLETTGENTTAFADILKELNQGGRLSTDDKGNVIMTSSDGTTTNLTDKYGTQGSAYLQQAQDLYDTHQNNIAQWQSKYQEASYQETRQISQTQGAVAASMSASGLSIDSSSIAGASQKLAEQNHENANMNASFLQAKGYLDKSYANDTNRLSTGFEILSNQAAQAYQAQTIQANYAEQTFQNAKNYEATDYQIDTKYFQEQQDAINQNSIWSGISGVLGVVEAAAGVALMFVPGGQAVGMGMILQGTGGAVAGFSGQGGAKTITDEAGGAAQAFLQTNMFSNQPSTTSGWNTPNPNWDQQQWDESNYIANIWGSQSENNVFGVPAQ